MNKRKPTEYDLDFVRRNHNKLSMKQMCVHLNAHSETVMRLMRIACSEKSVSEMYLMLEGVTRRNRYLVQLDDFCYLVHFSEPIEPRLIKYCPIRVGCDYDVHPVSDWEFSELQDRVPVIHIESDLNYQYNFWFATQQFLNKA
jgi:hypothetical protein